MSTDKKDGDGNNDVVVKIDPAVEEDIDNEEELEFFRSTIGNTSGGDNTDDSALVSSIGGIEFAEGVNKFEDKEKVSVNSDETSDNPPKSVPFPPYPLSPTSRLQESIEKLAEYENERLHKEKLHRDGIALLSKLRAAGYTIGEIASFIPVHVSYVSQWNTGRVRISQGYHDELVKLVKQLDEGTLPQAKKHTYIPRQYKKSESLASAITSESGIEEIKQLFADALADTNDWSAILHAIAFMKILGISRDLFSKLLETNPTTVASYSNGIKPSTKVLLRALTILKETIEESKLTPELETYRQDIIMRLYTEAQED